MTHYSVRWLSATLDVRRSLLDAVALHIADYYRPFDMRRGLKVRRIDRPVGALRFVQSQIKSRLLASYPFPSLLHGSVRRRSPLTNAREHLAQPVLVTLDLADFYPSVSCAMVHAVWRDRFGFGPPIATLLTRLTTYKGHVPQGAPTSGYLANLAILPAAREIQAVVGALDCRATFYVDDISVSGARAREALDPIISILERHGLSLRHGKTHIATPSDRQTVTGYTVNNAEGPSVPRQRSDRIREAIHETELRRYHGAGVAVLDRSIRGRIAYVRLTNPGRAARLDRQLARAQGQDLT